MKIAFSTSGNDVDSELDPRFGRSPKFLIYDTDKKDFLVIDNLQNLNAAQGAGIQAAQNIIETGAAVVITGHTGPKAYKVLKIAGIKVYYSNAKTVQKALSAYQKGLLKEAHDADVEGHWE